MMVANGNRPLRKITVYNKNGEFQGEFKESRGEIDSFCCIAYCCLYSTGYFANQ